MTWPWAHCICGISTMWAWLSASSQLPLSFNIFVNVLTTWFPQLSHKMHKIKTKFALDRGVKLKCSRPRTLIAVWFQFSKTVGKVVLRVLFVNTALNDITLTKSFRSQISLFFYPFPSMGLHKQGISFEPSLCNSTYLLKLMMTVSDCHKKRSILYSNLPGRQKKNHTIMGVLKSLLNPVEKAELLYEIRNYIRSLLCATEEISHWIKPKLRHKLVHLTN